MPQGIINKILNPQGLDQSQDGVDSFLRPISARSSTITHVLPTIAAMASLHSASGQKDIAGVSPLMPNTIQVLSPNDYTSARRNHELTHVLQNKTGLAANPFSRQGDSVYDYGGQQELQGSNRPISDFNLEQQAKIVEDATQNNTDYQNKARAGVLGKIEASDYDEMKAAYHPYLRQLNAAQQPGIDTNPEPPGPPPSALTGMLKPDPLIGGPTVNLKQWAKSQSPLGK